MLTLIDRGCDVLVAEGPLGDTAAQALRARDVCRAADGGFYGHITYASLIARRGET